MSYDKVQSDLRGLAKETSSGKHDLDDTENHAGRSSPSSDGQISDDRQGHYGSTSDHIFADAATADYWRLKYEKAGYENRHRFDPDLQWTAEEERKLVRKVRQWPRPPV